MISKSKDNHVVIFDTNILHETADNKCNYTNFSFNKLFQNIVDEIEARDLIESVSIAIPEVTWNELYTQRFQSYNEKNVELNRLLKNYTFPNLEYEIKDVDYSVELNKQITLYKTKLSNYSTKILTIDLPSKSRFESIMNRAFSKIPPFEGKSKKSDKGFKDALIWESIIEYKANNTKNVITLYARDGLFNDVLSDEYFRLFSEKIQILNTEEKVIKFITEIQKKENGQLVVDSKGIKYYEELKEIVDFNFIQGAFFDAEVKKEIGSDVYDLSEISNFKIENIIEATNSFDANSLLFEIRGNVDITLSNVEKGEDLSFEKELLSIEIMYSSVEKDFYLLNINTLNGLYEFDNFRVGGGGYV